MSRFFILPFVLLLQLSFLPAQILNFEVGSEFGPPGTIISIPISVDDFTDIYSFSGSVNWDEDVVDFIQVRSINTGVPFLSAGSFGLPGEGDRTSEELTFVWDNGNSFTGVSVASGAVLFVIDFLIQPGPLNTLSTIDVTDTPTDLFYIPTTTFGLEVPTVTAGTVLRGTSFPVTWASFDTYLQDDRSVALEWSTAQEANNDYFEVERRTANGSFESIARVDGAGNSASETSYKFVDRSPLGAQNFYRLRQVDLNGSFSYSEVRMIRLDDSFSLDVFPTPASDQITLALPQSGGSYRVAWMDITGRTVKQEMVEAGASQVSVKLSISSLPAGTYQLMLQSLDGRAYRSRVVKQ